MVPITYLGKLGFEYVRTLSSTGIFRTVDLFSTNIVSGNKNQD